MPKMKLKLCFRLALKNIKAHKSLNIAFILSTAIMLSILQIYININASGYVQKRPEFRLLMFYGALLIGIFSLIFIIYANSTIIKSRKKELALYGILGLEKKHIMLVVFLENLIAGIIIILISAGLTFSFGKLFFLLTGNLLKDNSISLSDYRYLPFTFGFSLIFLGLIFLLINLANIKNIRRTMPIMLLNQSKTAEKEPKLRWPLLIIGCISLALGYGIAFTAKGNMNSLGMFFIAALLVMMATYWLFTALSILILKALRKNKNYYYQKQNYIFISGMLQRMKSNAAGLASISILICGLIITLAASLSIYQLLESNVNSRIARDYQINFSYPVAAFNLEEITKQTEDQIKATLGDAQIENAYFQPWVLIGVFNKGNRFDVATEEIAENIPAFLEITTIEAYNAKYDKDLTLKDNEILCAFNSSLFQFDKTLLLADKEYQIVPSNLQVPNYLAVEACSLVVADYRQLTEITDYYAMAPTEIRTGIQRFSSTSNINLLYAFDIQNDKAQYLEQLRATFGHDKHGVAVENKAYIYQIALRINGGILFTGIILTCLFLVGTILIIYYKQITEGYEDRRRMQIMQKVGLSQNMIKKTANKQILWLFFTPLSIALIHAFAASKIVYQLLCLFGIKNYAHYAGNMLIITALIALVYLVIFKITANVYYKIVAE